MKISAKVKLLDTLLMMQYSNLLPVNTDWLYLFHRSHNKSANICRKHPASTINHFIIPQIVDKRTKFNK